MDDIHLLDLEAEETNTGIEVPFITLVHDETRVEASFDRFEEKLGIVMATNDDDLVVGFIEGVQDQIDANLVEYVLIRRPIRGPDLVNVGVGERYDDVLKFCFAGQQFRHRTCKIHVDVSQQRLAAR